MDWQTILAELDWATVPPLDVDTLTLGELMDVEIASGRSVDVLLRGRASRRMLGLYFHLWRTYGSEPPWHALASLRVLGASPSAPASRPAGA